MIDFVKILVNTTDVKGLFKKVDDTILSVTDETGEIGPIFKTSLKNLKFEGHNSGTVLISGSIHKYKNDGDYNYDDFTFSQATEVIHEIFDRFDMPLDQFKLQNVEFGVNIIPPAPTDDILDGLVMHKRRPFLDRSVRSGNYKQAEHSQYFLKAYNKSQQYSLPQPLLRWEIKIRTMQMLAKYGIRTIQDLLCKDKLQPIGTLLANHWNIVLMIDPTFNTSKFTVIEKSLFLNWNNPLHWKSILKKPPADRNRFAKDMNAFRMLTQTHSRNIQPEIRKCILQKWEELLSA